MNANRWIAITTCLLSAAAAAVACSSNKGGDSGSNGSSSSLASATQKKSVLSKEVQTGLFGTYTGQLIAGDKFAGEIDGTQDFSVSIQPATPTSAEPRHVADLHLVSNGDAFPNIDFSAPLDVYVNGATADDGSEQFEFRTAAAVIPGLTGTRVELKVILTVAPGAALKVDSSQSSIRILDCGFSGNAGCDEDFRFAEFSAFGKRMP